MHGDAQEWSGLMMKPEMMDELPCNSFYRIACKQKHLKFIETVWLPGIHDEIRNFKGFRYRLVIPPTVVDQDEDSDEALEYVVILYFTGIQNLRCWAVSEERQHWVYLAAQQNITVGSLADSEVPTDGDGDGGDPDGGTAAAAATAAVWTKSKATKIELRHDTMKSAPKLLPPPRYKLFLVIWLCVYSMNVANLFSNDKLYMISLGVPYSAALFVELTHTMSVIIYAMSPLILSLTWVAKWIKAKRPPPERMSPLHRVFDQGLEIFAAAQRERIPPEVAARLDRLEGRAERLKRVNHDLLQLIHRRADGLVDALKEAFPPAAHPALARALRRIATEESLLLRDAEDAYGGELVESGSWGNFAAVDADDDDGGGGDDKERGSRPGNGGGTGSNVADVALARSTLATPSSEHATATASRHSGGKADRSSGSRGSTRETTTTTTRSGGINERDPALEKLRSFIKARLNEGKEGGGEAGAAAEAGAGVKRCGCRMPCNCAAASRGMDGAGAGASGASMAMSGDGSGVGDEGAVPGQWGMLGPVYTAALKDDDGNDGADLRHSVKVGAEATAAHDTPPPPPPPPPAADAPAEECPVCLGRSPSLCDLENQMEQKNSVAAEIESKPLTMCVAHYVRWERTLDFEAWIQDMFDTMSTFPGFIGQNTTPPVNEDDPYLNAFSFERYKDLYAFLVSPERQRLMRDLQPLLVKSSVASLADDRITPDAFGCLLCATGAMASARPPPLWKTTMLTVISLELIVWPITGTLLPMLLDRGVHVAAGYAVCSFMTVFLNVYVGLPLMHFFFGAWLRLPRPPPAEMTIVHQLFDAGQLVGWSPTTVMVTRLAVVVVYLSGLLGYGAWLKLYGGGAPGFK